MGENKDYDPGVYRRLELVQKQFKTKAAAEQKEKAAERRREFLTDLRQRRQFITRIAVYSVLGAILLAVILVVILDKV